ncbi:MAG: SpoIID/LytB domain-containing protein [Calditrichaeota bacterium]|nr:MAG: SpoIID/LytB domain-containing protein [Calditrichota bacterium]
MAALMLALFSCTRPMVKPAPESPTAREPTIRVLLTSGSEDQLQFNGTYRLAAEEADYLLDASHGQFQVSVHNHRIVLKSPARFFDLVDPQPLTFDPVSPKASFVWNGHSYRGRLILILSNGQFQAINQLPVEAYLLGVVPNEMPSGNPEYREAVRAQAVAARTYALHRLQHPAGEQFDVFSTVQDQVYWGSGGRIPELVQEAVEATRGEVLVAEGQPAAIQYHSTCGGILEPPIQNDSAASAQPDSSEGLFHCSASPLYRWVEKRTVSQLLHNLAAVDGSAAKELPGWQKKGVQVALHVRERSPSGRVALLDVEVDSRHFPQRGYGVRQVLADSLGRPLPSRLFFLLKSQKNPALFYIIGAGWGHGRGMCQWGALGMALNGNGYRNILHFYYPNLTLKKLY